VMYSPPIRVTLPDAPAPTSRVLEQIYYPSIETVLGAATQLMAPQLHTSKEQAHL
jgi:hypothetical protein